MKGLDLKGQQFGRLTVLALIQKKPRRRWLCVCNCGQTTTVTVNHLRRGEVQSCGCWMVESRYGRGFIHGHSNTRIYRTWANMFTRCYNPNVKRFKNHGGRGIKVCDRWHVFEHFFEDMGDKPEGFTLERIDNNKDYSPDNCKWATLKEQANNRRSNHFLTYNGQTQTLSHWAENIGIQVATLWRRINVGWPIEKALTTKVQEYEH